MFILTRQVPAGEDVEQAKGDKHISYGLSQVPAGEDVERAKGDKHVSSSKQAHFQQAGTEANSYNVGINYSAGVHEQILQVLKVSVLPTLAIWTHRY